MTMTIKRYIRRSGETVLLYPSLHSVLPEPLQPSELDGILADDLEEGKIYEVNLRVCWER